MTEVCLCQAYLAKCQQLLDVGDGCMCVQYSLLPVLCCSDEVLNVTNSILSYWPENHQRKASPAMSGQIFPSLILSINQPESTLCSD